MNYTNNGDMPNMPLLNKKNNDARERLFNRKIGRRVSESNSSDSGNYGVYDQNIDIPYLADVYSKEEWDSERGPYSVQSWISSGEYLKKHNEYDISDSERGGPWYMRNLLTYDGIFFHPVISYSGNKNDMKEDLTYEVEEKNLEKIPTFEIYRYLPVKYRTRGYDSDGNKIREYFVDRFNDTNTLSGRYDKIYREANESGNVPGKNTGNPDDVYDFFEEEQLPSEGSRNLIENTNRFFESNLIKTMINRFYDNGPDHEGSITESAVTQKFGVSKGRNLLSGGIDRYARYDNPYCRVWTKIKQYSRVGDEIRSRGYEPYGTIALPEGYRPNNGIERLSNNSVLNSNGRVRIAPEGNPNDVRKCMFSIENLAWKENPKHDAKTYDPVEANRIMRDPTLTSQEKREKIEELRRSSKFNGKMLTEEQIGPNGGRIMWFPPYNIKFSENINTEWNGSKFIGRGENIYSYVNTERSGVLSFTLLIDHPSLVNTWARNLNDGKVGRYDEDDEKENRILRFFAGCDDVYGAKKEFVKQTEEATIIPSKLVPDPFEFSCIMYFPNNYSGKDDLDKNGIIPENYLYRGYADTDEPEDESRNNGYEMRDGFGLSYEVEKPVFGKFYYRVDEDFKDDNLNDVNGDKTANYRDNGSFMLNSDRNKAFPSDIADQIGISKENFITFKELYELIRYEYLPYVDPSASIDELEPDGRYECITRSMNGSNKVKISIECTGFASSHGKAENNKKLIKRRADVAADWMRSAFPDADVKSKIGDENKVKGLDVNSEYPKRSRFALIKFRVIDEEPMDLNSIDDDGIITDMEKMSETREKNIANIPREEEKIIEDENIETYDNEYMYFSKLEKGDNILYQKIKEKIKYFNPAFHSMTPEGFNARLTFLNQCTRQGPTNSANEVASDNSMGAGNLAFGRAPYCILRIGDFYNTKIAIDSISIDYGDQQWDMNPEGAGVQPMLANVNMNFKFIGGSDISGPIEELQNAVSFNYFGNTSIYDRRSSIRDDKNNGEIE